MTIEVAMLLATGITTTMVEILKKKTNVLKHIEDWIEVVAVVLGMVNLYWFCKANGVDVSNLWNVSANGFLVGLASIGAYKLGNATPVTNKLLPPLNG